MLKEFICQNQPLIMRNSFFLELFKEKWNRKATKAEYNYMATWFSGRWCNWQIFHNPPGYPNTNYNIESFNATIKRDFSLRKRYSVFGSVNVIIKMIIYYSTHKKTFQTTSKFNENNHNRAKKFAKKFEHINQRE